jgi:hypothetical protein
MSMILNPYRYARESGETTFGNASREFDGVNDFVEFPITEDATAFTASMWVYLDTLSGRESFFYRTNGVRTNYSQQLGVTPYGNFFARLYDGGGKEVAGSTSVSTGTWYHIAMTAANSGNLRLYVDGSEEGTAASVSTMWTGGDRYWVGHDSNAAAWHDGLISGFQIYHSELSSGDIATLASYGDVSGAVLYAFGNDDDVLDYSGNGNDGTNNGSTYSTDGPLD